MREFRAQRADGILAEGWRMALGACGVLAALLGIAEGAAMTRAQNPPQAQPESAAAALHALFDERYAWEMREFPETAMSRGDYSRADHVTDNSLAAIERRQRESEQFLSRLREIARESLSDDDQLNYDLFERGLADEVEGFRFRVFLAPIGGRFGPQQDIPQMNERVRFNTPRDYENYLTRIEQMPRSLDNTIEAMRLGMKEGRVPPRVCVAGVGEQFSGLLQHDGLDGLRAPLMEMKGVADEATRQALRQRFDEQSLPALRAGLQKLSGFFSQEYLPACRESIAARDWPDGAAYYAYQLRVMTTTKLTAQQIFDTGQREVARIRSEMMQVIRRTDFMQQVDAGTARDDTKLFGAFLRYLRTDPRFYHASEAELLTGYRDVCKRIDAELPHLFKTLPRNTYGVKKIPDFMAPQQTTAYYSPGDLRNAEPGYFYANTYALDQRPKYEMVALSLHEAVPGHHFQIALAQEIRGAPEFRKDLWFNAFGEGWALYAERLGIEMGLYADPYDDFGRLLYEMWRACRLVVDPGMHALGWTRAQAVQFMRDNTALSELNINAEVDRYINLPGQATAYKLGELKIRELRARAEKALGDRFDIREFHDAVLLGGSLPLDVLERRIDAWIGRQAASGGGGAKAP